MATLRILIVEDEKIAVVILESQLRRLGYRPVGVASTGDEAVAKAGELKPDLILMDVVLPQGMDGIEAARTIQTRFDIPVVFLTGKTDDETLERAKRTEPFGYLCKPAADPDLHAAIEVAFVKHRMEREQKRLLAELQKALAQVKKLSGLLPICSKCKKIRDDKGYWSEVESYIHHHSEAEFTHGICPACAEEFRAQLDRDLRSQGFQS